jgi:alkylhydroperoxidase family enzyme
VPDGEVRIPPRRRRWLDPADLVAYVAGRATGGDPPRVFTTVARHPGLFWRWLPFASSFMFGTALRRRDAEMVILRTAWNCDNRYEWAQHVALAARAGLDHATIDRIPDGPEAPGWSARDAVLLRAVDELHERRVVTDDTWAELAIEFRERQLIELCFLVGHYEMLAMALNTLGVQPEGSALRRLDAAAAGAAAALGERTAAARGRAGKGRTSADAVTSVS